jgi:translation initiation factor 1 (eIF-1/SUI1)
LDSEAKKHVIKFIGETMLLISSLSDNELEIKAINLRLKKKCGFEVNVLMEIAIVQHGETQHKMTV